ncbi:MAG: hypothetical protein VKN33_10695 [Candidatus Sericytochromatia bacterium]|nr:hypothetical protein [Candidatus Sericytochromatia bacterium]
MAHLVRVINFYGVAVTFACLTGCDLTAAALLVPGVGQPLRGRVVDSRTRLPVGNATVIAGLGQTVSDASGVFHLFGNFTSDEVSVSRAGYVSFTQGDIPISQAEDIEIAIEPMFAPQSALPVKFLQLSGPVQGLPTLDSPALVSLGGTTTAVSNAAFSLEYKATSPGQILSSVLAWGTLSGPYIDGVTAPQPFHFLNFAYQVGSWRLGDTIPASAQSQALQIASQVPISPVRISYSNLGGFRNVQTDVLLDFGVLGVIPVARALASNQSLPVPAINGLKYVIEGEATDAAGKASSLVSITTNDPSRIAFSLLQVPRIVTPTPGATSVGQRPTFRWTPLSQEVIYEVVLREVGEVKPKWVARTRYPEVTFPAFAQNDINGGALRPDRQYTWSLRALEILEQNEVPSPGFTPPRIQSLPRLPVRPYRVRKREVEVREMGFSL